MISLNMTGVVIQNDTGITRNDASRFIGTWDMQPGGPDPMDKSTYAFYENGTFISIFFDYNENHTHKGWGDYTVWNGTICMKARPEGAITDNQSYCYIYEFSEGDNHVMLQTSELPTVTMVKVK